MPTILPQPPATPAPAEPHLPYRYFVSFAHEHGFGHMGINRPQPITDIDQVKAVAEFIRDHNDLRWVTIITFQLFADGAQ